MTFAGYFVDREFLAPHECAGLLDAIGAYRRDHELPTIERLGTSRPLRYKVINGDQIAQALPRVSEVADRVRSVVAAFSPQHAFFLDNESVAINVNIVSPGGSYRWHYDRNAFTGLVYLNAVTGGEIEMYPNSRLLLGPADSWLRRLADSATEHAWLRPLGKKVVLRPAPGLLLVMPGDRCLHSVAPVSGDTDRINLVISFNRRGRTFPQQQNLDRYLYSTQTLATKCDSNYTS